VGRTDDAPGRFLGQNEGLLVLGGEYALGVVGGFLGGGSVAGLARGIVLSGCRRGLARKRLRLVVALAAPGEHLDRRGHYLRLPVAHAAVVFPLPRLQPSLDGDLLALAEVLAAHGGETVPNDDVVILRVLLAVAPEFVRGDAERGDGRAVCQSPKLRISGQTTRKQDLVHGPNLLYRRRPAATPYL
jgi:hypothetical protein